MNFRNILFFNLFIYYIWRLITLQYCGGFCHALTWISRGCACVPLALTPSHLRPHPIPLGCPSAEALMPCSMHQTWTGHLFHIWKYTCFNAFLSNHLALPFPYSPKVCSLHLYLLLSCQFSSVTQSCRTLCDPHGLQHTRPPCPSPTPRAYPGSCLSSQWCHPTILILCRPLLLLPSIFPSIRVSSNESALRIRWPK